nr:ulp1 protease family, C-terminal catalytic domain-containing protein [Tanacetum cinerariifolium]
GGAHKIVLIICLFECVSVYWNYYDDPIVTDFMEKTRTKRTRASDRLMKLKEANGTKRTRASCRLMKLKKLMMAYVNGSKCSSFNVIRKRPPTLGWTSELLREREDEKLNYGGFGFGEIEGLFVEQEDPMPDNIEKKSRFEKTLDAAEYIFPGKLAGFFERYIDALKYQGCRKEGSGNAYISYANRAADAQADRQNNKGASFVSVQAMIGEGEISLGDEHADIGMDQEDAKIERRKWFDMSDIPSFSLGLTQEYGHLDQDVVTPVATTQEPNLASKISNPVPLRVCPPGTAVGRLRRDTDKRPVTICEVRKSPFIGRVVDANGSLNAEKKRVTKYLFEVLEDHRFQSFMGYVVNAIENKGKCELLKDIDVIFIPVDNGGHIFLFVVDLKNSRPLLIDHEKNEKIIRKRVKDIIGTSRRFWTISNGEKSYKSWNFIGTEIEVGEFDWQTNSMETEAGIFVMRHMETCMGMGMDELNCCLVRTTCKLKKQLFLRKKYSAKILLSECNILKETVVQNAPEFGKKPTKVPLIGI